MLFHFIVSNGLLNVSITPDTVILSLTSSRSSLCRYYGDILRSLHNLFGNSESDDAVRDNAAGAIARMIMVQPQSIPLNQV
jgi:hypothetical protein